MSEKSEINVLKEIRKQYRKDFVEKTSMISFLTIVLIICLIPAYFVPATLFLTVPLIALPAFLGFIICNLSLRMKATRTTNIFLGFKAYYSKLFFGVFKFISGFLKSVLVYLIFSTILLLILHFSVGMKDVSYANIISQVSNVKSNGDLTKIVEDLQENSTFIKIENISVLVSFGLATYMFFHHVLTHSFKLHFNLASSKPIPAIALNYLHKRAFPNFRKDFYNDYYSSFWLLIILYVVGYVGGALLSVFVFKQNGAQAAIISTAFGIIASVFYLPYMYDVYQLMYPIDSLYYLKAYGELLMVMDIPELKLSPKEKEEMDKNIAAFEKMLEDARAELKKEKAEKKTKKKHKSE